MDLNLLPYLVAVAEEGSFSAAARKLGVPKSSVSRRIAALEEAVGTRLLHRTTRQVSLSTAGTALYERSAPLLASLKEAVGAMPEHEQAPSGVLKLTAPNDIGNILLPEIIARFGVRYPAVTVDVWLTNRVVNLVGEGFDLALRATRGKLADSTMIARKLGTIAFALYAAPQYLARKGMPRTPEDLVGHDWVLFRHFKFTEPLLPPKGGRHVIVDDFFFVREAVRAGAGIGAMPTYLAQAYLATGELQRVYPRYTGEGSGGVTLLYPKAQQQLPRKVTAFRDFLLEHFAERPLSPRS